MEPPKPVESFDRIAPAIGSHARSIRRPDLGRVVHTRRPHMYRRGIAWMSAFALALLLSVGAAEARLSVEWVSKWRADLAYARDSLPHSHPNFYHAVSPATYRTAIDSLDRRVPGLEHEELVVELARIMALVHDGHTRVTFPFDSAAGFFTGHSRTAAPKVPGPVFHHYPVRFGLFADTLWVIRTDSTHRDLLGGRVVRLGTMSAAQAMAAVEPVIQRDNESQVRDLTPTWLVCPEVLRARHVVADPEHTPIVVEDASGRQLTGTLAPVPLGTRVEWIEARAAGPQPLRDRSPARSHWFTNIPGSRTIYARYREVLDDPEESVAEFADSLFGVIERSRADRLVIDLRGNVGGNGFLNRPLVQHVIRSERLWKPGGLWVLIDRGTFSAAVMMAADLEMRTPAVLVGEMTGGHPNSYGDSRRVVLPNTGITVRVSSLYHQLTGPDDPRDGITPLVPMEMHFADWRANRDPALDVALAPARQAMALEGNWSGEIALQAQRLALKLELVRSGTSWQCRMKLPAAGLENAAPASLRVVGNGVAAQWATGDDAWRLTARPIGDRLVGVVHYKGLDFATALEHVAR